MEQHRNRIAADIARAGIEGALAGGRQDIDQLVALLPDELHLAALHALALDAIAGNAPVRAGSIYEAMRRLDQDARETRDVRRDLALWLAEHGQARAALSLGWTARDGVDLARIASRLN